MSTGGDPPISYASLAPFYDDYFLAYGSSFWNPEDMSLALAATLPPPPPRLSDGLSHDGRTRSTSVSSRKVAEQRLEDPTSITDMFAEKVVSNQFLEKFIGPVSDSSYFVQMVRYRQEAYTVTIDAPAPADDPGKYTAFDVYVALGKKSSTMSLPSTRWGPMPTLYHPLVLPPHHYYTIFSKRFVLCRRCITHLSYHSTTIAPSSRIGSWPLAGTTCCACGSASLRSPILPLKPGPGKFLSTGRS